MTIPCNSSPIRYVCCTNLLKINMAAQSVTEMGDKTVHAFTF